MWLAQGPSTVSTKRGRKRERGRTDDFKGVCDDAHGHELLSVVAAVHHERVGEALDNGALCLAEALDGVLSS